jgi:serine/threonine-protein kinase
VLNVGDIIAGRYQVEQLLGEGGMARVYRVRHLALQSTHALKVLNPELAAHPEFRTRFTTEGQIQAQLRRHPHIVAVTEIVAEPGVAGLVMDFVEGENLEHFLRFQETPLSNDQIITLFSQVLDGVGYAHAQGVIHRDLKPANLLLERLEHGGVRVRILDFGIAKVRAEADESRSMTRTGFAMGTHGYMSPEQIKSPRSVTNRSDLFSLGATLYELATLKRAFPGDSDYEVMDRIVHEQYPAPETLRADLAPAIAAAIRQALRADPAQRFSSCEEFAHALQLTAAVVRRTTAPDALRVAPPPVPIHDTDPQPLPPGPRVREFGSWVQVTPSLPPEVAAAPASLPAPGPLADAALAEALWKAAQAEVSRWPRGLQATLQRGAVERVPYHQVDWATVAERREVSQAELLPPRSVRLPPVHPHRNEGMDPWSVPLPHRKEPTRSDEKFIVEDSVTVRTCSVCQGGGGRPCAHCQASGGARCDTCTGTGHIACVLCDGMGQLFSGGPPELCPRCHGAQKLPCDAPGCTDGRIPCQLCKGQGHLGCSYCQGTGQRAKGLVLARGVRHGEGAVRVLSVLPQALHEGAVVRLGRAAVSLHRAADGIALDVAGAALNPVLARARTLAREDMRAGWQPRWDELTVRSAEAYRLRVSAGAAQGEVWLLGADATPWSDGQLVQAWRQGQAQAAAGLAAQGDVQALAQMGADGVFEPGDARTGKVAQALSEVAVARWSQGEVESARALRDQAPALLAEPVTQALAQKESSLGADAAARQRRLGFFGLLAGVPFGVGLGHLVGAAPGPAVAGGLMVLGLGWLPVQLWMRSKAERALKSALPFFYSLVVPVLGVLTAVLLTGRVGLRACDVKGVWGLDPGGKAELELKSDGEVVTARGTLPGLVAPVKVKLKGRCEAGQLELRGDNGTFWGTLTGSGMEGNWRPTSGPAARVVLQRE